ncbi:MAG: MFS transporter [Parachlamydiales bacterium]|nr:MFS transporter [Parachlamydiales bacterium]
MQAWKNQASDNRFFIFLAMITGFCISCEYAIVRPIINSVFLSLYSSTALPIVWIVAIPINLVIVSFYNRYLPLLGLKRMFMLIMGLILVSNVAGVWLLDKSPLFTVFHFIWKETYVLLLYQSLWSVIHSSVSENQSKSLYGLMFGIGGFGSVVGSLIPGFFAQKLGSENLLLFSVPVGLLLIYLYFMVLKYSKAVNLDTELKSGGQKPSKFINGIQLIMKSPLLKLILVLVCLMQLSATLIDFQFNAFLQEAYPLKNLRTEFMGQLGGIISTATLIIQFLGVYLLTQWLGLRGAHMMVPVFLACNALAAFLYPSLSILAVCFASIKIVDFSVFGVIKEMLYVGLPRDEKFQAKAVIDVFFYRTAKAAAALIILFLQITPFINQRMISGVNFALFIVWVFVVLMLFKPAMQAKKA